MMESAPEKIKSNPDVSRDDGEDSGGGAGGKGNEGGGGKKRKGGWGGGGGGGGGGRRNDVGASDACNSLRQGGCGERPSNLVPVGRIVRTPSPEFENGSGGKMVKVHVETWVSDSYNINEWWIELPMDDAMAVERRNIMIQVFPLPPNGMRSSLVQVQNGGQGRLLLEDIKLALFEDGVDGWDMISGTPPAWFASLWDTKRLSCVKSSSLTPRPSQAAQMADVFKGATVHVTLDDLLNHQRDWLTC
eukprot:CAMPEP_0194355266 /NCGR_PEP_ID=MMETSP0174-20130528/3207_1 /TAXON_ID=216777 /ORGANISM="Proboscia alata, Strain PI-D3" /LENGTH=245 /DNA_ID=CAMNT_0039124483 /DNA_START=103 /DNA_END=840 /DNA_ORIENTATION=+